MRAPLDLAIHLFLCLAGQPDKRRGIISLFWSLALLGFVSNFGRAEVGRKGEIEDGKSGLEIDSK